MVLVAGFVIASCPLLVNLYRWNARRKPALLVRSPSKIGGGRPHKALFAAASAGAAIGAGAGAGAINTGAGAGAINTGAGAGAGAGTM